MQQNVDNLSAHDLDVRTSMQAAYTIARTAQQMREMDDSPELAQQCYKIFENAVSIMLVLDKYSCGFEPEEPFD